MLLRIRTKITKTTITALLSLFTSSVFAEFSYIGNQYCGVYAGFDIGAGYTNARYTLTNENYFNTLGTEVLGYRFKIDQSGTVGGGHIGYNYQFQNTVIGIEGAILSTSIKKNIYSPFFSTDVLGIRLNQLGLINAHIGYATDPWMPYISGGFAMNQSKVGMTDYINNVTASVRERYNGWTVGGGLEYKFTPFLSLGVSYDYIKIKAKNRIIGCASCGTGIGLGSPLMNVVIDTSVLMARLNYYMDLI